MQGDGREVRAQGEVCEFCGERPPDYEVQVNGLARMIEMEKVKVCGPCLSDVQLRARIGRRIFDA